VNSPLLDKEHLRMHLMQTRLRLTCVFFLTVVFATAAHPPAALAAEQRVKINVGHREIHGTLFVPSAPSPAPGILMLHTRGGLLSDDISYASDLSKEGFVSLVVDYLNPQWGEQLQHPGYIDDLVRVIDFFQMRPEVQEKPLGVVGFSLGSKGVMLAARHKAIKAVVSYYGIYDLRLRNPGRQSYPPMPVDVAPGVQAPVRLLHGTKDDETPLNQAESMRDALLKAGKVVEFVVYPGATHAFDRGFRGRCGTAPHGFYYCLDPKAKQDAWIRTLAWFRKYLSTTP
jgi:carboxymethylenebutenolidase